MKLIHTLIFVFVAISIFAQERNDIIQQRIEFISEQLETESIDLTNLIEQLNFYYDEPININTTNGLDLEDLGLLTDVQINDLILHRKVFGKFISIYELQTLKYWDLETIYLMLPLYLLMSGSIICTSILKTLSKMENLSCFFVISLEYNKNRVIKMFLILS